MNRRAILAAAGALCAFAAPASAHAMLERAEPAVGASLHAPPQRISLRFTEGVEPVMCHIELVAANGAPQSLAPIQRAADSRRMIFAPLHVRLGSGRYVVRWRVVSVDGHTTTGHYTFSVEG